MSMVDTTSEFEFEFEDALNVHLNSMPLLGLATMAQWSSTDSPRAAGTMAGGGTEVFEFLFLFLLALLLLPSAGGGGEVEAQEGTAVEVIFFSFFFSFLGDLGGGGLGTLVLVGSTRVCRCL